MKKSSKTVMKIVAILLCLVLATSSIVSTTLAKFVVAKDAKAIIKFDKLGFKLEVYAPKLGGEGMIKQHKGDSASITFNDLHICPNLKKDNMIRFYLTDNRTNVPVNLVVKVDVTTHAKCVVESSTGLVTSDTVYMPIAFTVGTVTGKNDDTWANEQSTEAFLNASSNELLDEVIENAIATEIAKVMGGTRDGNTITKAFSANSTVTLSDTEAGIAVGFNWPLENTITNGDLIETYIANRCHGFLPITITYTVSFEQTAAA